MVHQISTFCRICGAHCGLIVEVEGNRVVRATGDPDHPLSAGYTCHKGRSLPEFHHDPRRLDRPAIGRGAERRAATWAQLNQDLSDRIRGFVDSAGPDAVAVFTGSGAGTDSAGSLMARRFVKALGTRSIYSSMTIDAPSKPLAAAWVGGHPALFAAGIDAGRTTLTLLVGANPVVSHGHTNAMPNPRRRLRQLVADGELWIVDPRRTETAAMATRYLAPRPGTDHVWLSAVVREMLGRVDLGALRGRARGVDELAAVVAPFTMEYAHEVTGIPLVDLTDLCEALRRHGRFAGLTGTGVTMARSAPLTQWLLMALLVITDSADAPGGTVFNPGFFRSLDAFGWRPGRHAASAGPRSHPELPRQFGELPAAALADEIEQGNVRALVVLGGSLASAMPDAARIQHRLGGLEVLAVADVVETGTTRLATHVLPCAGQLERADLNYGTDQYQPVLNGQYTDAVVPPATQRRELWRILADLAGYLGLDILPDGMSAEDFDASVLFEEATRYARGDLATLMERRVIVDPDFPVGWVKRGVREWGGWQLAPPEFVELLSADTPATSSALRLVPMRQAGHFNSQLSDSGDTPDGATVFLNSADVARLGLRDRQEVTVTSEYGDLETVVRVDDRCAPGVVAVPHGFERVNVNELTSDTALEPLTGMPTFSGLPVTVAPRAGGAAR